MGNVTSGIEDLFWPDQRYRRFRAYQLQQQCADHGTQFNSLTDGRDQIVATINGRLNTILQNMGLNGPTEVQNKVRSTLSGTELANYDTMENTLDLNNNVSQMIWNLANIAGIINGYIVGVTSCPTLVTEVVAKTMATNLGIVLDAAAKMPLAATNNGDVRVIFGQENKGLLQRIISDVFDIRAVTFLYIQQMRAIRTYIATIDRWSAASAPTSDKPGLNNILMYDLYAALNRINIQGAYNQMNSQDTADHSWTNEDPKPVLPYGYTGWRNFMPTTPDTPFTPDVNVESFPSISVTEPSVLPTAQILAQVDNEEKEISLILVATISQDAAVVSYSGQLYRLSATILPQANATTPPDENSAVDLQQVVFKLSPWTDDDDPAGIIKPEHGGSSGDDAAGDLQQGFKIMSVTSNDQ